MKKQKKNVKKLTLRVMCILLAALLVGGSAYLLLQLLFL